MRGEYGKPFILQPFHKGSPPHARGIRPSSSRGWLMVRDHPRMRGEYFAKKSFLCCGSGSPPHARGILEKYIKLCRLDGITPACAGNTCFNQRFYPLKRDHPRMRGEYFDENKKVIVEQGSPPHARGIHCKTQDAVLWFGITPACAGNTSITLSLHIR